LDLQERLAGGLDRVPVREIRAGKVDGGERPEHGVVTVPERDDQKRLVGHEREECERDGRERRAPGPDVDREHLAEEHHRYEADPYGERGGECGVARVRQPPVRGRGVGEVLGDEVVDAEDERHQSQARLGGDQQWFPAHSVDQGQPDEVDHHQDDGERDYELELAHDGRRFGQYERRVRGQAADASGALCHARHHHYGQRAEVVPVGEQLTERRPVFHVLPHVGLHQSELRGHGCVSVVVVAAATFAVAAPVPAQASGRVGRPAHLEQVVRRLGHPEERDKEQHGHNGGRSVERVVRHVRADDHFEQDAAAELYGEHAAQGAADANARDLAQEHRHHRVRDALAHARHQPGRVQGDRGGHEQRQRPGDDEQRTERRDHHLPTVPVHQVAAEQRADEVAQVHHAHYPR